MQIHIFLWIMTVLASVLLIVSEVQHYYVLAHPYLYPALFGMCFLFVSWKRRAMMRWLQTMQRHRLHFFALLCLIWVLLFGIWIVLSYCNSKIFENVGMPMMHSAEQSVEFLNTLASPEVRWQALYRGLLIIQTLWVSSYIAAFSQGRTVRGVILGAFFWPGCIYIASYAPLSWESIGQILQDYRAILSIFGGVLLFILSGIFVGNHATVRKLAQLGLPDKNPRKFYGVSGMTKHFINYAFFFGALFSVSGWYFLQMFISLGAMMTILFIVGILTGLFYRTKSKPPSAIL